MEEALVILAQFEPVLKLCQRLWILVYHNCYVFVVRVRIITQVLLREHMHFRLVEIRACLYQVKRFPGLASLLLQNVQIFSELGEVIKLLAQFRLFFKFWFPVNCSLRFIRHSLSLFFSIILCESVLFSLVEWTMLVLISACSTKFLGVVILCIQILKKLRAPDILKRNGWLGPRSCDPLAKNAWALVNILREKVLCYDFMAYAVPLKCRVGQIMLLVARAIRISTIDI